MPLSWNEVKKRAIIFSKEWENESSEKAEAKTFWDNFFDVFGISRRRVASFEQPVLLLDDSTGYIDLFWKGVLVVEHKSKGRNLDKAYSQAIKYFHGLKEEELPKYVLVSDFNRFRLYNLEENIEHNFLLSELHKNIHLFDFILGYKKQIYKDEDPVNIQAANLMGKLHDALKDNGYEGHKLEIFLVRILFCLFADDTGIFPQGHFEYYLKNRTKNDGSDLGSQIAHIFQILDSPEEKRQKNIDEDINTFPYVNGELFKENLEIPSFDSDMRNSLLECSAFNWSKISPAIFGSLFQSVMDKQKRRDLGAHYTSEKNILKVINGLFLDELKEEFKKCKSNENKLKQFHTKISSLKFLDPACGCGNFLIIAYRELRLLELKIIKELSNLTHSKMLNNFDVKDFSSIDVDCMYGIEIEEFPSRIAEVAMWLIDHQMNIKLSVEFGDYFVRIPLKKSPHIHNKNALRIDWNEVIPKNQCSYILGNPPFIGKQFRNTEQNFDMELVANEIKGYGVLDFVCLWYIKSANFIQGSNIKVAFVSTNSISQGEQVGVLWNYLFSKNIKIHFAHRPFKWTNEAKGNAKVFVVIIGFGNFNNEKKKLYDYNDLDEAIIINAKNINQYLVDSEDIIILNRSSSICDAPEVRFGSMPNDGGFLLFDSKEKSEFVRKDPETESLFRRFYGGEEFINNIERWCLWLLDIDPKTINKFASIKKRVELVYEHRIKSKREATNKLAKYPYLFAEIRQPKNDYILIPLNTSSNRKYIPIGFMDKNIIASNLCSVIENGSLFHFGVLGSTMHMSWMRQVCGRLGMGYRYSNLIVYNNFPFPLTPSEKNLKQVEEFAQLVLDVRKEYPNSSLADLYDPLAMPKKLVDAHNKLDKAVDLCYRPQPFPNELSRLEFLFDLYKKYTEPMFTTKKKGNK